ncbi:hypothetical protein QSV37_09105 [Acinetobacter sp. VNK23]|uniref:hypothetical protein n=1 Tax=Acinetobacter thutiue TaxID=2998078 RepID=UPI002575F94C|nr:hypothetical protein [Acinetobacter thutiue]MDM1020457.1 hypothetical protein [Acinetobacter thutiue]
MGNYYEFIRNKPLSYNLLIYGVIFLIFLIFYMKVWGYELIAIYKSKKIENILEACAYYDGTYKSKYSDGYYIVVDKYSFSDRGIYAKGFPFSYKQKEFYESLRDDNYGCHKVKYIKIDLYVVKKIFIYDYLGTF